MKYNSVSFWSLKTTVIPEGSIPVADSTRTSRVKPRFVRFSRRERIWNVCLHARENHLGNAFCTLRGTLPTEAIIIPREIKEVRPQVRPSPSEDIKGGKEEEAKLELTFFAKCQKEREEEEPETLLHFLRS